MDSKPRKKLLKRASRKTIAGIKLPPIEPTEDEIKTILDIDPHFYSLVDGRPIRPDTSIKKYKENVKNVLLNKTLRGYLEDETMRIDREMKSEKEIFERADKHFEECRRSFDKFLAYDNDKTIVIMKKSDGLVRDISNQTEEHKTANYELAQIKSKISYVDETLLILLSLENFLHKSSPIIWQQNNNVILDVKRSEIVQMDNNIFQKVDIEEVMIRLSELSPPKLYFDSPEQLLKMFDYMEKQNLHFLLKIEELGYEKRKFFTTIDKLKKILQEELDQFQRKIDEVEESIAWNIEREVELQQIFDKILQDKIQYLVCSDAALQLMNYVEFAYEKLIAPNETKLSVLEMTQALESEYQDLMLNLSAFDVKMIKEIEKDTYEISDREIKHAKEASTMLKNVDKLYKRLNSAYEPSRKPVKY